MELESGEMLSELSISNSYSLKQMIQAPQASKDGFLFDFGKDFNGRLYFGFTNAEETTKEQVIYFKKSLEVISGRCELNMEWLKGKYDMIEWEKKGFGTLGYRLQDHAGQLIYDGRFSFSFKDGVFMRIPTILEGPFINQITPTSAVLVFKTDIACSSQVQIDGRMLTSPPNSLAHEFKVNGLNPNSRVSYLVKIGPISKRASFYTYPEPGTRAPFLFAYASDSRAGQGGGERDLGGTNAYIMKRIMAANQSKGVKFMQFTGDLINGYLTDREATRLQYANWKRAVEPWWHEQALYVGFGNHEALVYAFGNKGDWASIMIDRFPFGSEDAESLFAEEFSNFENGPESEDGSALDPNSEAQDFPSYKENCFSYTYDNVAMIVLNSNYWYAPDGWETVGGNPHAYIMDNQLAWLEKEIRRFEDDVAIDHIFVTQHTPAFPNGGHVSDDMWYRGKNDARPRVAGKSAKYGILERRDQYLDIIINKSTKMRAILTGDEHNYNKLQLGPKTPIYLEEYEGEKLVIKRSVWQINNGSAGAPYYAQEQTPWTSFVSNFSTQNVVVYLHVHGMQVRAEVINPVTFEKVDDFQVYPK